MNTFCALTHAPLVLCVWRVPVVGVLPVSSRAHLRLRGRPELLREAMSICGCASVMSVTSVGARTCFSFLPPRLRQLRLPPFVAALYCAFSHAALLDQCLEKLRRRWRLGGPALGLCDIRRQLHLFLLSFTSSASCTPFADLHQLRIILQSYFMSSAPRLVTIPFIHLPLTLRPFPTLHIFCSDFSSNF
ncbi:hypothetical protein B0H14DRAFT_1389106 [Mycena olivaceomarginata]|nr:hypothetical protein B0H14DRAFT_1389106 [Mycena olivaceomarginata]